MHSIKVFLSILFSSSFIFSTAQQAGIQLLQSQKNTSLRGLSVVDDNVFWVSGSNGTIGKSLDGGKTMEWLTVAGYEKRDFRDVEAFDANTAIIMAVAEPAVILKTKNGGKSWYKVFEDSTKGMFLDAMDFDDKGTGVVIGDPINNNVFKAMTIDYGEHWFTLQMIAPEYQLKTGEAFFAASGTNIQFTGNKDYPVLYVTGGTSSRLFYREKYYELLIKQGKESTGANSVAISNDGKDAVIVGGDFSGDTISTLNCVLVHLKKEAIFSSPQTPPHGYRSCAAYITKQKLICCGTSGVDISNDGGNNWQLISSEGFHVCAKAKKGSKVFLAGSNGRIATLLL